MTAPRNDAGLPSVQHVIDALERAARNGVDVIVAPLPGDAAVIEYDGTLYVDADQAAGDACGRVVAAIEHVLHPNRRRERRLRLVHSRSRPAAPAEIHAPTG